MDETEKSIQALVQKGLKRAEENRRLIQRMEQERAEGRKVALEAERSIERARRSLDRLLAA